MNHATNVVSLRTPASIPVWAELMPQLIPQLVARVTSRQDALELGAQLHGAIRTLSEDRYRPIAEYFAASRGDALKLVALTLTASWDAEEPIDLLFSALTEEERAEVLTYAAEFGDLLSPVHRRRPLAVEPISGGLAAAGGRVLMSQKPNRYRFRIVLDGAGSDANGDAEVEVRLGGGPLELRQVSGPSLMLVAGEGPLPHKELVAVPVDDGTDLACWLQDALCRSGDDAR